MEGVYWISDEAWAAIEPPSAEEPSGASMGR